MAKPAYLSPVQYEAIAMAVYHGAFGFQRVKGGFWTLPGFASPPFADIRDGDPVPLWKTTRQTIKGFARRGFVNLVDDKALLMPEAFDLNATVDKPTMPTEAFFMRTAHTALKLVSCGDVKGFWFWESGSSGGLGQLGTDPCYPPMIVDSLVSRGWLGKPTPRNKESGGPLVTWLTSEGRKLAAQKGRW